jgi:hypothetical protein
LLNRNIPMSLMVSERSTKKHRKTSALSIVPGLFKTLITPSSTKAIAER